MGMDATPNAQSMPIDDSVLNSSSIKAILDELERIYSLSYDSLTEEYKLNIEVAQKLGERGWVINGSITPNDEREWINIIESKGEAAIAEHFTDNVIDQIIDNTLSRYTYTPENKYLWRAFENYHSGRFTEAAMFLLGFLDNRISKMPLAYRKWQARCQKGFAEAGEKVFTRWRDKPITRLFAICDYIPSFSTFAERLFYEDQEGPYNMSTGQEPPYLNRNWLMHGRMSRTVKKYECIQLINTIDTLMIIEEYLEDTNDGQA